MENLAGKKWNVLGACANAPMAQIGKDFYEDLTETSFRDILDKFSKGEVPTPGASKMGDMHLNHFRG